MRKGSKKKSQQGEGIKDILAKVNNWAKANKVVSRAANLAGNYLPGNWGTAAKAVGEIAGNLGYGKRRRRGGMKGKGMLIRV